MAPSDMLATTGPILYDSRHLTTRWVSCLDLLGMQDRLRTQQPHRVFEFYAKAIERAHKQLRRVPGVACVNVSDTFVIYSMTDDEQDFFDIERATRWFAYFLITGEIPVRGAMACDELYADRARNIFFGHALTEAYEYEEAQDWIGLIMTPTAVRSQKALCIPPMIYWADWNIPFKEAPELAKRNPLPACIPGQGIQINGRNQCLDALVRMRSHQDTKDKIQKYDNTIDFINKKYRHFRKGH